MKNNLCKDGEIQSRSNDLCIHYKLDDVVLDTDELAPIADSGPFEHDGVENGEVQSVAGIIDDGALLFVLLGLYLGYLFTKRKVLPENERGIKPVVVGKDKHSLPRDCLLLVAGLLASAPNGWAADEVDSPAPPEAWRCGATTK